MLQTGGSQTWRAAFVIMTRLKENDLPNISEPREAMTGRAKPMLNACRTRS
jgi:hypothetical protein